MQKLQSSNIHSRTLASIMARTTSAQLEPENLHHCILTCPALIVQRQYHLAKIKNILEKNSMSADANTLLITIIDATALNVNQTTINNLVCEARKLLYSLHRARTRALGSAKRQLAMSKRCLYQEISQYPNTLVSLYISVYRILYNPQFLSVYIL